MYRTAIIGLGHVAAHQIAAITASDDFLLCAGCDTDASRFALLDGMARPYGDIASMLADEELDIVVIASPNVLHVDHAIQVMSAGKWVLMEKPLAESMNEFERFEAAKYELGGRCTLALHAAFGREMEWLLSSRDEPRVDLSTISSFEAEFDDPYIEQGRLLPQASSLGGSWMDSGINALSVVCRLIAPDDLSIVDSRMHRDENLACLESRGTVSLDFRRGSMAPGKGEIRTSWERGLDRKITTVGIGEDATRLILDHSGQRVLTRTGDRERVLYECDNGLPRLTNHYIGVFRDLARQMSSNSDNSRYSRILHEFLFAAEEWPG